MNSPSNVGCDICQKPQMGSGADKFSICLNAEINVPMASKDIIEIDKILICEGCFPKVTDKISKFFTKLNGLRCKTLK